MELENKIALGSAGVAVAAAAVAGWQAWLARRSAEAAERQAAAAEAQIVLMSKERDERDSPRFAVISAVIDDDDNGQPIARLEIQQTSGVELRRVQLTASGEYVRGDASPRQWNGSVQGGTVHVELDIEWRHVEPVEFELRFNCVGARDQREWTTHARGRASRVQPSPTGQGASYRAYRQQHHRP
ncbi:hypothetical protein [Kitasatospora sp. NPDC088346]|uniref:hypothetical protein n=1 Tax=Kitasatospora sp. NPDC088346 TaxID=3364073 RepID=UPI00381B9F46